MRSVDLHKVWSAPNNSRLTAKQASFRLPVHVAAKINALCKFYPTETKTEIIGDMSAAALEDLIAKLPAERGRYIGSIPKRASYVRHVGPPSVSASWRTSTTRSSSASSGTRIRRFSIRSSRSATTS